MARFNVHYHLVQLVFYVYTPACFELNSDCWNVEEQTLVMTNTLFCVEFDEFFQCLSADWAELRILICAHSAILHSTVNTIETIAGAFVDAHFVGIFFCRRCRYWSVLVNHVFPFPFEVL